MNSAMLLAVLRVLLATLGAMTAPDPGAAYADVAQRHEGGTATASVGSDPDRDSRRQGRAILAKPAPVALTGSEEPGRKPYPAGERLEHLPRPRHTVRAREPRRCGAFAPGELPPALAFLRMNGNVNANGAGT